MLRHGRPLTDAPSIRPSTRIPNRLPTRLARHPWFTALGVGFVLSAGFHLACVLHPAWGHGDPPARHGVFTVVNLAAALGVWLRPRWLPWPFAVLCAQQIVSHGAALLRAWQVEHRVDLASVLVLIALPWTLVALVRERARNGHVTVRP